MIQFFVPGIPKPGGSKRAFRLKTGRIIVTDDCKKSQDWKTSVRVVGEANYNNLPLMGPLSVRFDFFMPRPKAHYRKDGTLKPNAPRYHISKPDRTKLIRSTEDALTKLIWHDDAQIVEHPGLKLYAPCPESQTTGVRIVIVELEGKIEANHEATAPTD